MPRQARGESGQSSQPKSLPPIQYALSARQQREVLRYASNFGAETAAVLREVQTAIAPAVERAVARFAAASDGYEKARDEHERVLRAQFRGAERREHADGHAARAIESPDVTHPASLGTDCTVATS
jgi:hypothetical protein